IIDVQPCNLSLSPLSQSFSAASGSDSFTVNAAANCGWSSAPAPAWVTITPDANYALGTSTISYSVANNVSSQPRVGTVVFSSSNTQTFTINQAGFDCEYGIDSPGRSFPVTGGTFTVHITAASTCSWSAASGVQWVTFTPPLSGTGN